MKNSVSHSTAILEIRHYFKVGLCTQTSGPFNARLYQGCPSKVSAPHAKEAAICPTQLDSPSIWPMRSSIFAAPRRGAGGPTPPPLPPPQEMTCAQGIIGTLL
jgi:hypothetical protein